MPDLSIVIPTYNRRDKLCACIRSILGQRDVADRRIEIVVSDGASTDGTAEAVRTIGPLPAGMSLACRRSETRLGPGESRNNGAAGASGRVLAFIDDDCFYEAGALALALARFDEGCDLLRPRVVIPNKQDISLFTHQPAHKDFDRNSYGGVFFVRRNIFEACGGFTSAFYTHAGAVHLGEDTDFLFRCFEAGCADRFDPEVVVSHPVYPGDWRRPFFDAARVRVSLPFNRRWKNAFAGRGMNTRRVFCMVLNRESARIGLSFMLTGGALAALLPSSGMLRVGGALASSAAYLLLAASYLSLVHAVKPAELLVFLLELPFLAASYCFNFCYGLVLTARIKE